MQDGREDDPVMETTAGAVDEPNAGAVLPPAMAVTAFGPGNDAHIDADHDITLTLMTMTYRQNVPRCCAISFFARTLTYSVGRCLAIRLRAWSL